MTKQELIDGAIFIAGVQNADAQAESLLPIVFQQVALKYAATEEGRSLLRRTHTVVMSSGTGSLPDEALTACKFGASIADDSDVTVAQTQTLVPFWQDFIQPRDNIQLQLNWWIVKGDRSVYLLQPSEEYPGSFSGDLEVTIASVPAIPASAGTAIDADDEVISDILQALAAAIKVSNAGA